MPARAETGAVDLTWLTDVATDELERALIAALQDPAVQENLKSTVRGILADRGVRTALRPHLIEAAAWLGAAIAGGVVIGKLLTR